MTSRFLSTTGDPARGTVRGVWFRMLRAPLVLLARLVVGLRIVGIDNVPSDTGLLVVSNHLHNADPVLMAIAFPRPLHFMAKEELFRFFPLGWILSRFGNFPIARGKSDRQAIRHAINALHHDVAVGMFPEGTRSKKMALSSAHAGAGLVAIQGNHPILPIAITGSERLPFNGKRPPHLMPEPGHKGVLIRIGSPFSLPETGATGKRLTAVEATDMIMLAIAEMLPDAYRGDYRPLEESSSASGMSSDSARSAASTN